MQKLFVIVAVAALSLTSMALESADFSKAKPGRLARSKSWHVGVAKPPPMVVDLKDDVYGKALQIFMPARNNSNNIFRLKDTYQGKLIIDFDFKTNSPVSLKLGVTLKNSGVRTVSGNSALWLKWQNGKIYSYSGSWKAIAPFKQNRWHHLKLVLHLSGKKKGTFDINIDGGLYENINLPWRNALKLSPGKPLSQIWLIGMKKKSGDSAKRWMLIDNITITRQGSAGGGIVQTTDKEFVKTESLNSRVLKRKKNYSVILPAGYYREKRKWPVVFLFHGRGRHERSLIDDSMTRALLLKADFITILPDGDDGWYINSPVRKNDRYNDYIEEVMADAGRKYNVSSERRQRGICGWSMGGYGATMFAERHAGQFAALVTVIGLLDFPRDGLPAGQSYKVPVDRFSSNKISWQKLNPLNDAGKLKDFKIFIITGDRAFDRTMNQNFASKLDELGIERKFKIVKGGHSFNVVKKGVKLMVPFMNEALGSD